jgi:dTDP-4-dehydrorhamnose reductase
MRILISGGAGQLARAVRETWHSHELIIPPENHFDLRNRESVHSIISVTQPEVVLNLAAFTQVDRCEEDPELAMLVNGAAVGWMAEGCSRSGALLVQISTDYVFSGDGSRPYLETDSTGPLSAYGRSKLEGERWAAMCPAHLIARTAWLYDSWGNNFYRTMLAAAAKGAPLRVVDDQRGTPTTCRALARQLRVAVEESWRGIVNVTCQGETTWHGFAAEIFKRRGIQPNLSPCSTIEFPRPAPRPAYSVLSGERRHALGNDIMPTWQEALQEVVVADQTVEP